MVKAGAANAGAPITAAATAAARPNALRLEQAEPEDENAGEKDEDGSSIDSIIVAVDLPSLSPSSCVIAVADTGCTPFLTGTEFATKLFFKKAGRGPISHGVLHSEQAKHTNRQAQDESRESCI